LEDDDDLLRPEDGDKAMARADRRLSKRERESRLLVKRSEDYQVFDNVFDVPTLMAVNDLRSEGVIKEVQGAFASGKESKVYLASAPDRSLVTLKIYLTVSAEFKKRIQYIAGDPRFSDIKRGSRNLMALWARKEFKNMQAAHAAGITVPAPIAVKKNILVMEYMTDEEGNPARALADLEVTPDDYKRVIEQVSLLYRKAELVHADLSEYNICRSDRGITLFDFGSAVDIKHPNSKQFLVRDVININRFFEKRGVKTEDTAGIVEQITRDRTK
jgi:RIO kinase 1